MARHAKNKLRTRGLLFLGLLASIGLALRKAIQDKGGSYAPPVSTSASPVAPMKRTAAEEEPTIPQPRQSPLSKSARAPIAATIAAAYDNRLASDSTAPMSNATSQDVTDDRRSAENL